MFVKLVVSNLIDFVATMTENAVFIVRSAFINNSLMSHLNIMTTDYDYRVGEHWSRSTLAAVSKIIMIVALSSQILSFYQMTFLGHFLLSKTQC